MSTFFYIFSRFDGRAEFVILEIFDLGGERIKRIDRISVILISLSQDTNFRTPPYLKANYSLL